MAKFNETVSDPDLRNIGRVSSDRSAGAGAAVAGQALTDLANAGATFVATKQQQAASNLAVDYAEAQGQDARLDELYVNKANRLAQEGLPEDWDALESEDVSDVLNTLNRVRSIRNKTGQNLRVKAVAAEAINRKWLSRDKIVEAASLARGASSARRAGALSTEKSIEEENAEAVLKERNSTNPTMSLQTFLMAKASQNKSDNLINYGIGSHGGVTPEVLDSLKTGAEGFRTLTVNGIIGSVNNHIEQGTLDNTVVPGLLVQAKTRTNRHYSDLSVRITNQYGTNPTTKHMLAEVEKYRQEDLDEIKGIESNLKDFGVEYVKKVQEAKDKLLINGIAKTLPTKQLFQLMGVEKPEDLHRITGNLAIIQAENYDLVQKEFRKKLAAIDPTANEQLHKDVSETFRNFNTLFNFTSKVIHDGLVAAGMDEKIVDTVEFKNWMTEKLVGTDQIIQQLVFDNMTAFSPELPEPEGFRAKVMSVYLKSDLFLNQAARNETGGDNKRGPQSSAGTLKNITQQPNGVPLNGEMLSLLTRTVNERSEKLLEQIEAYEKENGPVTFSLLPTDGGGYLNGVRRDGVHLGLSPEERVRVNTGLGSGFVASIPVTGMFSSLISAYTEAPFEKELRSLGASIAEFQRTNTPLPESYFNLLKQLSPEISGRALKVIQKEDIDSLQEEESVEVQDDEVISFEELKRPSRSERLASRSEEEASSTKQPGKKAKVMQDQADREEAMSAIEEASKGLATIDDSSIGAKRERAEYLAVIKEANKTLERVGR